MGFSGNRAHRLKLAGLSLALVWSVQASAFAQAPEPSDANKEKARLLMDRGVEREESRDFPAALTAYEEAHGLVGLPMTGLAVARIQVALGRLTEALELVRTVKQMPKWAHETPAYDKARTSAAALEQQLTKRIPSIVVQVEGAGGDAYTVEIDGRAVDAQAASKPYLVNPGKHLVRVSGEDFEPAQQELESSEGEVLTISIVLKRLPAHLKKPKGWMSSPIVWAGFGVGAAGLIAGTVTGILSLNETSEIKKQCDGIRCPSGFRAKIDDANTLANVSNISFAIGGAGVVLGVVGILLSGSSSQQSAGPRNKERWIQPVIGMSGAGIAGTF